MTLLITDRLACWLKADAGTYQDVALGTPAVADGDPVGGWADQGGNGFNALQSVGGQRPSLKLGQLNGLPALQFSAASSQFLSLGTELGKPRNWSLFIVMAVNNPSVRQAPHGSVNSAGFSPSSWGNGVISQNGCPAKSSSPDFGDGSSWSQTVTGAIWSAGAYNLMSLVHRDNDSSIDVFKNGTRLSTTSGASSGAISCSGSASNFSIGREGDFNGLYLDGFVGEMLVYDINLFPTDRSSVEGYLKAKWGL